MNRLKKKKINENKKSNQNELENIESYLPIIHRIHIFYVHKANMRLHVIQIIGLSTKTSQLRESFSRELEISNTKYKRRDHQTLMIQESFQTKTKNYDPHEKKEKFKQNIKF